MEIGIGKAGERVDHDRFSELPDDVLLAILQLFDLRTAVRAGAVARRWTRLPRLLSDLVVDVADLIPHRRWGRDVSPHTVDDVMTAYTKATRWFLAPTEQRSIKSLHLAFYLIDPYLHSIGDAVIGSGAGERLEFTIRTEVADFSVTALQRAVFARRFMSFLGACPVAFSRLTSLTLQYLSFGDSDISDLLSSCSRLELLSLDHCGSGSDSILQIDAPGSSLTLEILGSCYQGIELTSVPKLERLFCDTDLFDDKLFPVRFGYVPCLRDINLLTLHLQFYDENPRQLSPAFSNLRVIHLWLCATGIVISWSGLFLS